jgi:hypothetical protein
VTTVKKSALESQEGGTHYKDMRIQPVEFIHANNLGFCEATAIKYLCRWRKKGGIEDLRKAIHFVEVLIELEDRAKWAADVEEIKGEAQTWAKAEVKDGPYCFNCDGLAEYCVEAGIVEPFYCCQSCRVAKNISLFNCSLMGRL